MLTTTATVLSTFLTFMVLLAWSGSQMGRFIGGKMNGSPAPSVLCAFGSWAVVIVPLLGFSAVVPALCVVAALSSVEAINQVLVPRRATDLARIS